MITPIYILGQYTGYWPEKENSGRTQKMLAPTHIMSTELTKKYIWAFW